MKVRSGFNILFLCWISALIACSNASLFQAQQISSASAKINFCTTPATAVVSKLKYLFVTDVSGSNQQNFIISGPGAGPVPDTSCGASPCGTDPTGTRRYSGLISFLQNNALQNSTNTYYAGLLFSTSPILPFNNFGGGGPTEDNATASIWYSNFGAGPVANTATYMAAQYQNIWCPGGALPPCTTPQDPGGWTDYTGTLTQVYNYIVQDINYEQALTASGVQPQSASSYVIFWTSDGFPYGASGPQNVGTILQDVQNIMNLKATQQYGQYISSINFNTAFYFTSDTSSYEYGQADTLLSEMANIGQGAFFQISNGQNIPYSQFSIPQQNPPFVLRDLWVHDASAVWWNGKLMADTDNDGIPDAIEKQWGSNPNAYDSDGNGIGDGVEYYLWGTPCGSISSNNLGKPGQTCTGAGANKSFIPGTCSIAGPYPDTDLDYLNDCEENLLGSNPKNFDSNGDFVPDQFEWLFNVPFTFGTNGLSADPANDGVSDYQKLKDLFPMSIPFPEIHGVLPLNYVLTPTSSNAVQSCYTAEVQNIPVQTPNDVIRVYIMETEGNEGTEINHMRVLKNTTTMSGTNTLIINDGEFTP